MGPKNSQSRQVKTPAFNILERIIIRNSLCERPGLQERTTPVKPKKEAVQNLVRRATRLCSFLIETDNAAQKDARHHLPYDRWLFTTGKDPTNHTRSANDNKELQEKSAERISRILPQVKPTRAISSR
jgi:hypothetical protein